MTRRGTHDPEWPAADIIVGNPPFLGDKKMRAELGDGMSMTCALYRGRIEGKAIWYATGLSARGR